MKVGNPAALGIFFGFGSFAQGANLLAALYLLPFLGDHNLLKVGILRPDPVAIGQNVLQQHNVAPTGRVVAKLRYASV